jgi:hypothetical protein
MFYNYFFVQIGELKKGLNPPSATDLVFVSPYMGTAIKTGLIIGIIALAVSIIQMPLKLIINHANNVLRI